MVMVVVVGEEKGKGFCSFFFFFFSILAELIIRDTTWRVEFTFVYTRDTTRFTN